MNTQIELRANIPAELADRVVDYFFEAESTFWGLMQGERNDPYEVFGFFPDKATAAAELAELRKEFPELPEDFAMSSVEDADWQNAYKEFVKPWNDRQLHWIPLWERENKLPPKGSAVVYLDAGMAFGTGAHETTRLCARRLLDFFEAKPEKIESIDLIDAGCGSGVLALSAAALGFKKVYGFDCDPEAIRVCQENAGHNAHIPKASFAVGDLEAGLSRRGGGLLPGNIYTCCLCPHSAPLVAAVKPGGILALSGILARELELVRDHYLAQFDGGCPGSVAKHDSRVDGEWADLWIQLTAEARSVRIQSKGVVTGPGAFAS